jgi:tetratricopeptide (TPR) repeat protein
MEIEPNYGLAHFWLGINLEQKGKYKEAVAELKKAVHLLGDPSFAIGSLGHAHAVAGHKAEAKTNLDDLLALSKQKYVDPLAIAQIYAGLEEQDLALDWLGRACDDGSVWLSLIAKDDPRLDSLRSNPRFQAVMGRMGLAQ